MIVDFTQVKITYVASLAGQFAKTICHYDFTTSLFICKAKPFSIVTHKLLKYKPIEGSPWFDIAGTTMKWNKNKPCPGQEGESHYLSVEDESGPFEIGQCIYTEPVIVGGEHPYPEAVLEDTKLFKGFHLFEPALWHRYKALQEVPFKCIDADMFVKQGPVGTVPEVGDG